MTSADTTQAPPGRERAVTAAFAELADTLVADYDVVDVLGRLATHCVTLLDITAAGLLATDGQGQLQLLASSNEQARLLELFALHSQEPGPCTECYATGEPVAGGGLAEHRDTWPAFTDHARDLGFESAHALPMRLRGETIGTLTLLRTQASSLGADDLALAAALADVATIGILHQRALVRSETLVEQLQGALNSRVVIEQAKGMIADRGRITPEQAFTRLRDYARAHNIKLSTLAHAAVRELGTVDAILTASA